MKSKFNKEVSRNSSPIPSHYEAHEDLKDLTCPSDIEAAGTLKFQVTNGSCPLLFIRSKRTSIRVFYWT